MASPTCCLPDTTQPCSQIMVRRRIFFLHPARHCRSTSSAASPQGLPLCSLTRCPLPRISPALVRAQASCYGTSSGKYSDYKLRPALVDRRHVPVAHLLITAPFHLLAAARCCPRGRLKLKPGAQGHYSLRLVMRTQLLRADSTQALRICLLRVPGRCLAKSNLPQVCGWPVQEISSWSQPFSQSVLCVQEGSYNLSPPIIPEPGSGD